MDINKVNNSFVLFGHEFSGPLATVISIGMIILGGIIALGIILFITKHILKKSRHIDDMLNTFFVNLVKVAGIIIIVAICLDRLGVGIGTIVTVLGAAGAAIALALKDSLANVAGGLMIIITQPFKKGDLIKVGEFRGRVQEIDLFLTTLRTLNYQIITVPNGLINTSILVNESREERRRVDLEFGISYNSDIEKAKDLIRSVCKAGPLVLHEPEPSIGVARHDDSAVVIEALVWCRTEDYFATEYYMKEAVKKAFDEGGIDIPFPQMDLHIKGGENVCKEAAHRC